MKRSNLLSRGDAREYLGVQGHAGEPRRLGDAACLLDVPVVVREDQPRAVETL